MTATTSTARDLDENTGDTLKITSFPPAVPVRTAVEAAKGSRCLPAASTRRFQKEKGDVDNPLSRADDLADFPSCPSTCQPGAPSFCAFPFASSSVPPFEYEDGSALKRIRNTLRRTLTILRGEIPVNEFEEEASSQQSGGGLPLELWHFLRQSRKRWLLPILLVMFIFGLLVFLSGTAAAPFIYTLF